MHGKLTLPDAMAPAEAEQIHTFHLQIAVMSDLLCFHGTMKEFQKITQRTWLLPCLAIVDMHI